MVKIANLQFEVSELLAQLKANANLWNFYDMRTNFYANGQHREVDDIWIRYRDFAEFDENNPESFHNEHTQINYAAYYILSALQPIIKTIIDYFPDCDLGGILITRVPAGKQIYPHMDFGWHARHYATKILVLLQSAPGQTFNFENESHEGKTGSVFRFNNQALHWINNDSNSDRISLLIALLEKTNAKN